MINLRKGHPSHSLAPKELLKSAFDRYLCSDDAHEGLAYGLNPGPRETQAEIASWLRKVDSLSHPPSPDNILITGGASTGLSTVLQKVTWVGYTRRVFMVAPTYYLAAGIFKDCGYLDLITGIPEDDEGLDIAALQFHLNKSESEEHHIPKPTWQKHTYRYVFYGVPTFSNPSGSVMSLARRNSLVELARKYDMLLITDDVYDLLTYTSDAIPPRLVTLDSPLCTEKGFGNTVSNCSFSKLLAPGLRFGFIQGRSELIHELSTHGATKSGGCPCQFTASALTSIVSDGTLDARIEQLKKEYSRRAKAYTAAIEEYWVPLGVKYNPCVGGYFFWIQLPEEHTSKEVFEEAMAENVSIMQGTSCMVPNDDSVQYDKFIRICIALEKEDRAVEGIRRLGKVFQKLKGNKASESGGVY